MIKMVIGGMISLVGILILAASGMYAVEATKFILKTESTAGEIVDHELTGGLNVGLRGAGYQSETVSMYAPIVKFRTATGASVRFRAKWSEGEPPPVGTLVTVRYPEQFPEDARIAGFSSLYGGAAILFLIGSIFAGAGGVMLRVRDSGRYRSG